MSTANFAPVICACCLVVFSTGRPVAAIQKGCDEANNALQSYVGQWSVSVADGPQLGAVSIEPVAAGCALLESWQGNDGSAGTALHWYDAHDQEWRQTYVDSTGWFIEMHGRYLDGMLQYQGPSLDNQGKTYLRRGTLSGLGSDTLQQLGEASFDGGKTWLKLFSIVYHRVDSSR
jgi:hypothetical protein